MSNSTRILAIVQAAPDIGTTDATYVAQLIEQAKDFIETYCCLPRFPEQEQGTSVSGAGASTDISGLSENSLYVNLDSTGFSEVELTLASCTSGAAIAAELQAQIRAEYDETWAWANATVTWDSDATKYTITSPSYGPGSRVEIRFASDEWHVAQALKLGLLCGGEENSGSYKDDALESICAQMVINAYRRIQLVPSEYDDATSKQAFLNSAFIQQDEMVRALLLPHRRLAQ